MTRAMVSLLLSFVFWSSAALAQSPDLGPATGSVTIRQLQVAFVGSGAIGGGELTFAKKKFPITVAGLGIGGIGASTLRASGAVYGLRRIGDFAGPYVQLREGWAIGDAGKGRLWLRNANGVTLRLNTQRKGLQLSMGADGVLIGFR